MTSDVRTHLDNLARVAAKIKLACDEAASWTAIGLDGHVCGPDCPKRPAPYLGPVRLGRRNEEVTYGR